MRLLSDNPLQRARVRIEVTLYNEYGEFHKDGESAELILEGSKGESIDPSTLAKQARSILVEHFSQGGSR